MRELVWAGAVASVIYWIVLFARAKWMSVRAAMLAQPVKVAELQKPGLIGEHLNRIQWAVAVRGVLEKAARNLEQMEDPICKSAGAALKASAPVQANLLEAARAAAIKALGTGELQTLLAQSPQALCYILVFPGRHEHSRLFRRYQPFTDGWLSHINRLQAELAAEGNTLPLLCQFYFLNPSGRDGVLLLAYNSEDGSMAPSELVDETESAAKRLVKFPDRYEFQLTYAIGTVITPGGKK